MLDQIEEWRPIPGYEGCYEVSNKGRVRNLERLIRNVSPRGVECLTKIPERLLCLQTHPKGYKTVRLHTNGKGSSKKVHSLVLLAFVGPRPEGLEGCHNDGNTDNNTLGNLRYDTHSENGRDVTRHGRRQLTDDQVRYVRKRAAEGLKYGEIYRLAKSWGVAHKSLYLIRDDNLYLSVKDEFSC